MRTGHDQTDGETAALQIVHEAVTDLPDPKEGPVTKEDVETLREADLDQIAEIAEQLV